MESRPAFEFYQSELNWCYAHDEDIWDTRLHDANEKLENYLNELVTEIADSFTSMLPFRRSENYHIDDIWLNFIHDFSLLLSLTLIRFFLLLWVESLRLHLVNFF